MTPNGVKPRLIKKLFSDANDANRHHKKKSRTFNQYRGMCIQNWAAANELSNDFCFK